MAVNVSIDSITTGIIAAIAAITPAAYNVAVSVDKPVRQVQRYVGGEFDDEEGFRRGLAGRCPAVRVRFAGSRSIRRTVGRRTDRVESTFGIVCISDLHQSSGSREGLKAVVEKIRHVVTARSFSLPISPMRFVKIDLLRDTDQMLAYVLVLSTRHYVDYTIDPGADTLNSASGEIVDASTTLSPRPHAPTLTVVGTSGSASISYFIVAIDVDGLRTLRGDTATITTAPDTIDSSNLVRLTWAAVPGAATYEVTRVGDGVIGTTAALTLDDVGQAASGDTTPEQIYEGVEDTFA